MKEKIPISGPQWEKNLQEAVSLIQNHETFFFSADLDPDSVGSMLSLSLYLRLLGKKVYMVLAEGLGQGLDFMHKIIEFNSINVIPSEQDIVSIKDKVDLVIFFDTANTKLVPFYSAICKHLLSRNVPVIEIDHHFGADSEEMTEYGIKLFRRANANTEIVAELLASLEKTNPDFPNPFHQRNILLALITGLLGDTLGGKVVPLKEDYTYWMETLGDTFSSMTHGDKADDDKPSGDKKIHFSSSGQIFNYMNRLDDEKQQCINLFTQKLDTRGGVACLNLLDSTYAQVKDVCRPFDSEWFSEVRLFLVNMVPEQAGKVGIIYFNGKNAGGEDCIFIKLRRAVNYAGFDLRETEQEIRRVFPGDSYMGGGGHPGAVSFRIHPMDEAQVVAGIRQVRDFVENNLT
ncbi:MAG: bifunctional oligoribonuclease/PAP phosphatase NrnA [Nitrospinales bacterium]